MDGLLVALVAVVLGVLACMSPTAAVFVSVICGLAFLVSAAVGPFDGSADPAKSQRRPDDAEGDTDVPLPQLPPGGRPRSPTLLEALQPDSASLSQPPPRGPASSAGATVGSNDDEYDEHHLDRAVQAVRSELGREPDMRAYYTKNRDRFVRSFKSILPMRSDPHLRPIGGGEGPCPRNVGVLP